MTLPRKAIRLGPVPCQGCRRLVAFVETWRDYRLTRSEREDYHRRYVGGRHHCPALPRYQRERMLRDYQRARAA